MAEDETRSWRWADADGVQSIVDEWELLSSLSTGTLPAYTLVWQAGWAEWLPACQVAELSNVIPADQVEPTVKPKLDAAVKQPPAPPIDKYTAYQTRAAATKLLGRLGRPSAPILAPPPGGKMIVPPPQPTPQIRSRTRTKQQVTTSAPPPPKKISSGQLTPPAPAPRPAQPTLVENTNAPATATLRPPGAVPPPPRGVPAPHEAAGETPLPPPPTASPALPKIKVTVPSAAAVAVPKEPTIMVMESSPSSEQPTSPQASPEPLKEPIRSEPLPSWSDDLDSEYRAVARPGGAAEAGDPTMKLPAQRVRPPMPSMTLSEGVSKGFRDRAPVVVIGVVALGGVAILAVVGLVAIGIKALSSPSSSASASVAVPPKPKPPPGSVKPCRLSKEATRIGPKIYPLITPVAVPMPNGNRIALGYAESEKAAVGITIDPATLEWTQTFSTDTETAITSVVPRGEKEKLEFIVDREGGTLRAARTLDLDPPAQFGWTDAGFTRLVKGQQVVTIWPGTLEDKATETRMVRLPGKDGFGVTFRRGGQTGEIFVGLLDEKGDRKTELGSLKSVSEVGTPAIAANEYGTLVAFAARPNPEAYWSIQLAAAGMGALPKSATPFRVPPGGPGADAISPAPEGLPNGGWLLQWTEGAAGKRQVRVQTLAADLVPVGDPTTLSPEEANAGQGVVIVRNGKALSLFLVKKGKTHELWGASLTCP